MIIFISGLPGAGKSTVGEALAKDLGATFFESDDFLTGEMREHIEKGEVLSRDQLDTWIVDNVIPSLVTKEKDGLVVAAGILAEENYRNKLSSEADEILYINLDAPYEVLKGRINSREHFAKKEMLDQGWAIKEQLQLDGPTVDASQSVEGIVTQIKSYIHE